MYFSADGDGAHDLGWPDLNLADWGETRRTLHMWAQVVGKVKLALAPFLNHWWQVAFALTARGLTTGLIPLNGRSLELRFDFRDHQLVAEDTEGASFTVSLVGQSVAQFLAELTTGLAAMGVHPNSSPGPSEVPEPIPFAEDTAPGAYDRASVNAWWTAMVSTDRVLQHFRTLFHGKSSPVNMFWGSFDLNHARYIGKPNPAVDNAGPIFRYGESQENFSVGFWPGTGPRPEACFYAYLTPRPTGIARAVVEPEGAVWSEEMGEFLLPYDTVRQNNAPDEALLTFFTSTYEVSADLAGWDRPSLEGNVPGMEDG